MREGLTTTISATEERMQEALAHPLSHLLELDATRSDLSMNVKIHVQSGVPPIPKAVYELARIWKAWTTAGLKVVDESRVA